MPLDELRDGMTIILSKNPDAPVVAAPYMITVPMVKQADLSGSEQTTIEGLGWLVHPFYGSYYYPALTLTELADVTGENAAKTPDISAITPPLPQTV